MVLQIEMEWNMCMCSWKKEDEEKNHYMKVTDVLLYNGFLKPRTKTYIYSCILVEESSSYLDMMILILLFTRSELPLLALKTKLWDEIQTNGNPFIDSSNLMYDTCMTFS